MKKRGRPRKNQRDEHSTRGRVRSLYDTGLSEPQISRALNLDPRGVSYHVRMVRRERGLPINQGRPREQYARDAPARLSPPPADEPSQWGMRIIEQSLWRSTA